MGCIIACSGEILVGSSRHRSGVPPEGPLKGATAGPDTLAARERETAVVGPRARGGYLAQSIKRVAGRLRAEDEWSPKHPDGAGMATRALHRYAALQINLMG